MVATPAETPVTMPLAKPTVATAVLLLCHVPPVVASCSVAVEPAHTAAVPVIAETVALTVSRKVATQPVLRLYFIVVVPADTPVTVPEAEPMVATAVLVLLQVPPEVASLNVVVKPTHTVEVPEIAAGKGLTVTLVTARHPVLSTYEITATPPVIPVTVPEVASMVAIAVLELLHVPPPGRSVRKVMEPAQTVVVPLMAKGVVLTVTVAVT